MRKRLQEFAGLAGLTAEILKRFGRRKCVGLGVVHFCVLLHCFRLFI